MKVKMNKTVRSYVKDNVYEVLSVAERNPIGFRRWDD